MPHFWFALIHFLLWALPWYRVASIKIHGIPVYSSIFSSIFFKFKYRAKPKFQYIQVLFQVLVLGHWLPYQTWNTRYFSTPTTLPTVLSGQLTGVSHNHIKHEIPDTFPSLPSFPLSYQGNVQGSVIPISNMKCQILFHPYHASDGFIRVTYRRQS